MPAIVSNKAIEIDISEFRAEIEFLKQQLKPAKFKVYMYDVMKRTAGHVKTILRSDLPQDYYVKKKDITSAVQKPKMTIGAADVGCVIPIKGKKLSIGGYYSATGGAHGWKVRKYRVKAKIVKSGQSTLPETMKKGGQPPFRNLAPNKLGKLAFHRSGKDRLPVVKIVGVAIPQMVTNRSRDEIEKDIQEYFDKQLQNKIRFIASR